jgi:hypothetical protein
MALIDIHRSYNYTVDKEHNVMQSMKRRCSSRLEDFH